MESKQVVQGVNMPVDLLAAAKRRAASEHRSLSGYVRSLIEADLRAAAEFRGQAQAPAKSRKEAPR